MNKVNERILYNELYEKFKKDYRIKHNEGILKNDYAYRLEARHSKYDVGVGNFVRKILNIYTRQDIFTNLKDAQSDAKRRINERIIKEMEKKRKWMTIEIE